MSSTDNVDFFKGLTTLTGLVAILTLYHNFMKDMGAAPLYVNTPVNAVVGGISFTKMR